MQQCVIEGDHPKAWSQNPHIKILLYIGKGIFRFPKISGPFEQIFINKLDFGPLVEAVQSPKFDGKLKICPNPDDENYKKIHPDRQKLVFLSKLKIRVGYHGH